MSYVPSTDVQADAFRKAGQVGALQEGGLGADDGARRRLLGGEAPDPSGEER